MSLSLKNDRPCPGIVRDRFLRGQVRRRAVFRGLLLLRRLAGSLPEDAAGFPAGHGVYPAVLPGESPGIRWIPNSCVAGPCAHPDHSMQVIEIESLQDGEKTTPDYRARPTQHQTASPAAASSRKPGNPVDASELSGTGWIEPWWAAQNLALFVTEPKIAAAITIFRKRAGKQGDARVGPPNSTRR